MPLPAATSRAALIAALRRDLVGPDAVDDDEKLTQRPSRWYLAGFLAPVDGADTPELPDDEQLELVEKPRGNEDERSPERGAARKTRYPSSMGMSLLGCPAALRRICKGLWGECSSHITQRRLQVSGLVSKVIRQGPFACSTRAVSRRRCTRS